jgi:hypothetical protein
MRLRRNLKVLIPAGLTRGSMVPFSGRFEQRTKTIAESAS